MARSLVAFAVFSAASIFLSDNASADWPEHRGNLQRTGFSTQPIQAQQWKPYWQNQMLGVPDPAWPAPARGSLWQKLSHIEPRVTDDRANAPLIALDRNGKSHVLVASTADDRLVCLDPTSGQLQWSYQTRAPLRYAPSVADGVAYFGADDGIMRAVDVASGKELWQTQIGPTLPWIVGNRRLISPHPIRTGVVAVGQLVYATAGLFPSQGVYSVALDRNTGRLVWRRKVSQSPQGYLLHANDDKIYVPTGRAVPYAIDAVSGKKLFDLPSPGGSFCMLTPEAFFAGPGNDAVVKAKTRGQKAKMLSFQGRQVAAGGGKIWTANGRELVRVDMKQVASGNLDPVWKVPCKLDRAMIVAGDNLQQTVFVAGGSRIDVFDAASGKRTATLDLPNSDRQIEFLAVSAAHGNQPELLIATTASGEIYAWRGGATSKKIWEKPAVSSQPAAIDTKLARQKTDGLVKQMPAAHGLALIIEDLGGEYTAALAETTQWHCLVLVSNPKKAAELQRIFQAKKLYGRRVVVWHWPKNKPLPFADELFNVVVEATPSGRSNEKLRSLLTPHIGLLLRADQTKPWIRPANANAGIWRHQYANPTNQADSRDARVGTASGFRLQWFGGVGPSRMPDRHLRGPAPLVAGPSMIMQGDGVLIGVDPANGIERWQRQLPPQAMRYVTPFDAPYACLNGQGNRLYVAARKEIWTIDAFTGQRQQQIALPEKMEQLVWGYLAEAKGTILASAMKPSAPRTAQENKTRYDYVSSDYKSDRPLVTSRHLVQFAKLNSPSPQKNWSYSSPGVIVHGSIAWDSERDRVIFVEARSNQCQSHQTDRVALNLLMQDAHLVCLDSNNGKLVWQQPLKWPDAKNVLFGQLVADKIILSTSASVAGAALYSVRVLSLADGKPIWQQQHRHIKKGLGHGEQVHHPVVLHQDGKQILVAEPYLYDLENGKRVLPKGAQPGWAIRRPGHSCGTLSGTGNCLFFRAGNPTVLNLAKPGGAGFTKLAPTRAGCWINMIPAGGRLLIPEGSASCVCNYSLQTSMAFVPLQESEVRDALPVLPDELPDQ